jgi:hypothetical protein
MTSTDPNTDLHGPDSKVDPSDVVGSQSGADRSIDEGDPVHDEPLDDELSIGDTSLPQDATSRRRAWSLTWAAGRTDDGRGSGPVGRLRYAIAYFSSLPSDERRERLRSWAIKPGLGLRIRSFLFPNGARRRAARRRRRAADGPRTTRTLRAVMRRPRLPSILTRPIEPFYEEIRSWSDARDNNLARARRILDQHGIRYIVLDDAKPSRGHLAVELSDRPRVIEAFERHAEIGDYIAGAPWTGTVRLQIGSGTRLSRAIVRRRLNISTAFIVCHLARFGEQGRVLGLAYGTVISLWDREADAGGRTVVRGSAPNRWSAVVPDADPGSDVLDIVERTLTGHRHIEDVHFPIDLVCLWVDGSDPRWNERRLRRLAEIQDRSFDDVLVEHSSDLREPDVDAELLASTGISREANATRLYHSRDELRYALRSLEMFAPFVNHVYLVTDRQTPEWLDADAEGLTVVDHRDIFPEDSPPVFNSNAIDTRLHLIPGLSEHFLVTNDDIFFFNPTSPTDFFTASGDMRLFLSKANIPMGDDVPGEATVDSAARNNRRLIEANLGVTITQKFKHIPLPQRRSIREEAARTYGSAVERTTRNSFRSSTDVSFSHLTLYHGVASGHGVVSTLPYDYVSLDVFELPRRLDQLVRRPGQLKVVCLNDADVRVPCDDDGKPLMTLAEAKRERDDAVAEFLERSFPRPSRWERSDFLEREREIERQHRPAAAAEDPDGCADQPESNKEMHE